MADLKGEGLKLGFDGSLRLEFHGLRSPRMPGFSPIVIWMRRWVYSIVCPWCFTIRGPGATSSTTSRPCYVNRYTAVSLAMKMSTMPIAYRLIRLCGGSPERRSTTRMPPAPTRWGDLRPRCCPSRTTSKPFRKSMVDGWKERCRKQLIDASFWIWTVQQVLSMASKKPLRITAISDAPATIPCFASTSSEIAKVPCFGPATFTARIVGKICWNQSLLGTRKRKSANTLGVMPPSPSQRFMNTWRRRNFCMPSGFPPTRCFRPRFDTC